MIHPGTTLQFINAEKGIGVVATQFIPKGTITWVSDPMDQVIIPEELEKAQPLYRNFLDKYTFRDADGNSILCWDHARFLNHSFNSNCMATAYNFDIAIRDIYPGEELTDDYGNLNMPYAFHAMPEHGSNRTIVYPDDLLHFHEEWDAKLIQAFKHLNIVDQPLWEMIGDEQEHKVRKVARGEAPMDSILNCYYNPQANSLAA